MSVDRSSVRELTTTAFESKKASYLLLALFLVALPVVTPLSTANIILVFCIFAVGYNLLLGFGGELSFGHSAFFAVGAYGTIVVFNHLVENLLVSMVVAALAAFVLSIIYGWISLRRRGLALALITLGLAQVTYFSIYQARIITGGDDGIGLPVTDLAILGVVELAGSDLTFYAFAAVTLVLVWLATRRILASPFGRVILAIRENEERTRALGYDTGRVLWITFIISGFFSGIAGILYALLYQFITPQLASWHISGEILVIALLGGLGTLAGPIVGAAAFIILEDILMDITGYWDLFFGLLIILIVAFAPQGIYGRLRDTVQGRGEKPLLLRLLSRYLNR